METVDSSAAVYAHDVDIPPALRAAIKLGGFRIAQQPEPGAIHLIRYGESVGVIPDVEGGLPELYLSEPLDPKAVVAALRLCSELVAARRSVREARQLLEIAALLGNEHDRMKLYSAIVLKARELTKADSGTLFVVEHAGDHEVLRFAIAQTGPDHKETYAGKTITLDNKSIAGNVAINGKAIRLADVYRDAASKFVNFDRSFDDKTGYRTKSMLCVPLMSYTGKAIGVLQLMNRKPIFEMPLNSATITESAVELFDEHDEELVAALGSHAALALRNAQLLEDLWVTKGLEGKNPLEN
jgi:hypothetical protein